MPKINYSKLKIYKLYCKDKSVKDIFVESTSNLTVKRAIHKRNLISKPDDNISLVINANGGWKNWNTCILEEYSCNNSKEAAEREKYWYNLAVNLKSPENTLKTTENTLKITEKSLKNIEPTLKTTEKPLINEEVKQEYQINRLQCVYCNKIYSRIDNLNVHKKTCKTKKAYDEKQFIQKQQQLIISKQSIEPIENNNSMIHANNSLSQSYSHSNNTTNTTNTIINNITNPVSIIPLGKENLVEFFSNEEQVKILKKMFGCFIYLVEYVHFSGKFPQFANIKINNLRSNIAYLYDEDDKKFNACDQNEVIAEVISERLMDITNFFDNVKDKLSEKERTKIQTLINDIEEQQSKYKEYQKKVKLIMYNKRHMV